MSAYVQVVAVPGLGPESLGGWPKPQQVVRAGVAGGLWLVVAAPQQLEDGRCRMELAPINVHEVRLDAQVIVTLPLPLEVIA